MGKGKRHSISIWPPHDESLVGTVHSHPSGIPKPSGGDLETFGKHGRIHIIIAYPFGDDTWRAYNANGEEVGLEIVE